MVEKFSLEDTDFLEDNGNYYSIHSTLTPDFRSRLVSILGYLNSPTDTVRYEIRAVTDIPRTREPYVTLSPHRLKIQYADAPRWLESRYNEIWRR